MTLRAFKAAFLVAIDDQEAVQEEFRDTEQGPVTLDELKAYLKDALRVDVEIENFRNDVGWQSAEVLIDELTELPPEEVQTRYGKTD